MKPADLKRLFQFNHGALHQNVKGLTNEEALTQPSPAGNCLNWVVGHIVATRHAAFAAMGESPLWAQSEIDRYKRSSPPILGAQDAIPFDRILHDFDRSQERLLAAFDRQSEDELERKPPDQEPLGDRLGDLHMHEAYHVGQTGVLRRLAGKEGAIR